ncbi:transposase [Brucella sp. 21LCYQ03]|nr:transposase [Brucella sp. 21LCYQ03]
MIEGLLPAERAESLGLLWIIVVISMVCLMFCGLAAPWCDVHERYGKWNSVYVRFRRWAEHGLWDALLETLVKLGLTDNCQALLSIGLA